MAHISRSNRSSHENKYLDSFISDRKGAGPFPQSLTLKIQFRKKPGHQMLTVPVNVSAILVKVNLKIQNSV